MTLVRACFLGSSCPPHREHSKDDVRLANTTPLFLNTLMSFKHLTHVAKAQQKAESVRRRKWGRQINCLGGIEVLSPPQKRKEKVCAEKRLCQEIGTRFGIKVTRLPSENNAS